MVVERIYVAATVVALLAFVPLFETEISHIIHFFSATNQVLTGHLYILSYLNKKESTKLQSAHLSIIEITL